MNILRRKNTLNSIFKKNCVIAFTLVMASSGMGNVSVMAATPATSTKAAVIESTATSTEPVVSTENAISTAVETVTTPEAVTSVVVASVESSSTTVEEVISSEVTSSSIEEKSTTKVLNSLTTSTTFEGTSTTLESTTTTVAKPGKEVVVTVTKEKVPNSIADQMETVVGVKEGRVIFVIDTTGSMGSYINKVKENLKVFSKEILGTDIKFDFSIVQYGDILAGDYDSANAKVTVFDNGKVWTNNLHSLYKGFNELSVNGGGDLPETPSDGFREAFAKLDLKSYKGKLFSFLLTDAPYKTDFEGKKDAFGIDDTIAEFKKLGVNSTVVGKLHDKEVYKDLYDFNEGIFIDIDSEDYYKEMLTIAEKYKEIVLEEDKDKDVECDKKSTKKPSKEVKCEKPVKEKVVINKVVKAPKAKVEIKSAAVLPNTGSNASNAPIFLGILSSLAGLFGLRRKNNK